MNEQCKGRTTTSLACELKFFRYNLRSSLELTAVKIVLLELFYFGEVQIA